MAKLATAGVGLDKTVYRIAILALALTACSPDRGG